MVETNEGAGSAGASPSRFHFLLTGGGGSRRLQGSFKEDNYPALRPLRRGDERHPQLVQGFLQHGLFFVVQVAGCFFF